MGIHREAICLRLSWETDGVISTLTEKSDWITWTSELIPRGEKLMEISSGVKP